MQQHRTLGRTGIKVSPFALGAMMLGGMGNPDVDESVGIVHAALDAGINLVDTADAYSRGASEEVVGRALQGRRDDVVLATKFHLPMGEDPNMGGNSRRWVVRAVEDSLRRLRTDHIDLYQVHRPAADTDVEETLSALSDLVRSGKVRAIGSSCFPASEIVEAQWASERRGHERFRTEQPPYSILDRGIERDILPTVQRHGMGAIVWSPLAGGMLTGRYRLGRTPDTHRASFGMPHMTDERRLVVVEQLIELADECGLPLTHLALGFAAAHPAVSSVIIGPRTPEQLTDLLAAVDVVLDDDVLDRIDAIVEPGTDVTALPQSYPTPAVTTPSLRRRAARPA